MNLSRLTRHGRVRLAVCLSLGLPLAACDPAQMQQLQAQLTNGMVATTTGQLPGNLEHIFAQSPYNDDAPLSGQYPRVAFKVLASPGNHKDVLLATNMSNASGCWQLSATIWRSATQSEQVAPFLACLAPLIQAPAMTRSPLRAYMDWFGVKATLRSDVPGQTTGGQRTDGPKPPNTPFPQGIQYARYFGSITAQVGPQADTVEAWFWAAVLYHMDFDPGQLNDRRVWVVSYSATP